MRKELLAIIYTDRNGLEHKVCSVYCLKKVFLYNLSLHETLDVEEYLARQKELHQLEAFHVIYGDEGIPETDHECEELFGKICNHCHSTLGAWYVCKWCSVVEWMNGDGHTCSAFPLEHDEDYEDEWQLTDFDGDQL